MEKQSGRGRGLVLVPCPSQGHLNAMLHLATILHSRGFSITIVHPRLNSPNPSNYPPDFNFEPISDGISDHYRKEAKMGNIVPFFSALNVNCEASFRDCMTRMLADGSREPVVCIIHDVTMHFARAVADDTKLPRIVLRTTSATCFIGLSLLPRYFPVQDHQLEEPVYQLPFLRVKDLPWFNTSNPEALHELVLRMVDVSKTASGVIWNSFNYLEEIALLKIQQDLLVPAFMIGPLHKNSILASTSLLSEDRSCVDWLNTQAPRSVIYVSFGSVVTITESDLVEMAWGLANSMQHFLWVVKPGTVRGSKWIELLPKEFKEIATVRGRIVEWAPQIEVLAHHAVGGFWTHGGWNSMIEGISEGVPMLCWPYNGDQKVNARLASHVWKVGMQLEDGLKRGEIEKAIRRLMVEGMEMRERAMDLKEKAKLSLMKGGSSCKSMEELVNQLLSF